MLSAEPRPNSTKHAQDYEASLVVLSDARPGDGPHLVEVVERDVQDRVRWLRERAVVDVLELEGVNPVKRHRQPPQARSVVQLPLLGLMLDAILHS